MRVCPVRSWVTVLIAVVAVVAGTLPALTEVFIFDRSRIFGGEVWRLWTGHIAHHGFNHLFWNLAVIVPAGVWLERDCPRVARWYLAVSPAFISTVLLIADPGLVRYAGLSGVATGAVVLLALARLRRPTEDPSWIWWTVLALVAVKTAWEFTGNAALFGGLPDGIRNVPIAHLAGIVAAVGLYLLPVRHAPAKTTR